jgi:kynurenine formamidase
MRYCLSALITYGAFKQIPEKVVRATSLVKSGRVYQLGRILDLNSPTHPFHGPLFYSSFRRFRDSLRVWRWDFGAMNVRIEITDHTGTHVDALNHVTKGEELYGGIRIGDVETEHGTSKLGAENFMPIITRGVLLDIPSVKGVEILPDDYEITMSDVESALKLEGLKEPTEGDAVLFRTGWGSLWGKDNQRYIGPPMPGISLEVAKWLSGRGVVLVGGDTPSVERIVKEPPNTPHIEPVHQHLIVEKGIFILENLDLEDLSLDRVYEFLFLCSPVRIRGATAGFVNPVAIA